MEGVDAVVGEVVGVVDPAGQVHVVRVKDELIHPKCGGCIDVYILSTQQSRGLCRHDTFFEKKI